MKVVCDVTPFAATGWRREMVQRKECVSFQLKVNPQEKISINVDQIVWLHSSEGGGEYSPC